MILSYSGFSVEALTLAHEDPTEHRRLYNDWMAAYPYGDPIEQAYIDQAVAALIEKRRLCGSGPRSAATGCARPSCSSTGTRKTTLRNA